MLVEQGMTFTVVARRNPLELPQSARDDPADAFLSARRVWLPAAPGTDWLHDGAAREVDPSGVHFAVETRRETIQIGAGGEVLEVIVLLYLFAEHTEIGRRLQGDLYEWAKRRAAERRKETDHDRADPAPDFTRYDADQLAAGVRSELAEVAKVPEARLQLVSAERREGLALYAVYRDHNTGLKYAVELRRDDATFTRLEG